MRLTVPIVVEIDPNMELGNVMTLLEAEVCLCLCKLLNDIRFTQLVVLYSDIRSGDTS